MYIYKKNRNNYFLALCKFRYLTHYIYIHRKQENKQHTLTNNLTDKSIFYKLHSNLNKTKKKQSIT